MFRTSQANWVNEIRGQAETKQLEVVNSWRMIWCGKMCFLCLSNLHEVYLLEWARSVQSIRFYYLNNSVSDLKLALKRPASNAS